MGNINIEKNKVYTIDILGFGYEGEGVGKIDNYPIFVPGALPGEKVSIIIVKVTKSHAFGKLLDILQISEHRREPICSIYKRCGGCQLQHVSYEEQLNFKKQRVKDCIERIGKLKGVTIHEAIGMAEPYRYRNKVQLPVGSRNGELQLGFYATRSHEIINMDACHIQEPTADKVVELTRQWMKKYNIAPYVEASKDNTIIENQSLGSGMVKHIMIRKGFKTGDVMVVLVTSVRELPYEIEFIKTIQDNISGIKSIIHNVNSKATNVILGTENITLWGEDYITDYIGKFKFNISPLSFFQINPVQTEILYNKVLEYANLQEEMVVFDAYCGTGTISLFLSEKAKKVYGVEIIPEAIENAKANALQNHIYNVEFIEGETERIIPELIKRGVYADVVVVDPPRKGCERSLLEALAAMNPKRIIYVSCDPSTLARDLAILKGLKYKTLVVQPIDMFPYTSHVECVTLIEKI